MCLLMGALLVASPMQALAIDNIYTEGNISSTYTSIMEDVLQSTEISDDYVYFRSGQYTYTLITGDLDLNGSVFTGLEVDRYTITTSTGNYNQTYTYSHSTDTNFSLNAQNYLVYSNLGYYPTLIERSAIYEYSTIILLSIGLILGVVFLRPKDSPGPLLSEFDKRQQELAKLYLSGSKNYLSNYILSLNGDEDEVYESEYTKNLLSENTKLEAETVVENIYYEVTVDYCNGSTPKKIVVKKGELVYPEVFTRSGYYFLGWFVDEVMLSKAIRITSDTRIYAKCCKES